MDRIIPFLRNRHFFNHMATVTRARTYLELFGGWDGARTIADVYERGVHVTASEKDPVRRANLEMLYPKATIYPDYKDIPVGSFDLVSCDPSVVMGGGLGPAQAYPVANRVVGRGIIAYVPLDLPAYIKRTNGDLGMIDPLMDNVETLFGTRTPTENDLAELFGGTIVARRDAAWCTQIAYIGMVVE